MKLGEERRILKEQNAKILNAALCIQKAARSHFSKKRYKEYIEQYNKTQERYMAALKIQLYFRSRRNMKRIIEREKQAQTIREKKGIVLHNMFNYIIKNAYRKIKLRNLLKTLDKLLKHKRKNLIMGAVYCIQYHARRFLKKLRAKRARLEKLAQAKKNKKKRLKHKESNWKIVNRGGKILRVNLIEEKRRKELERQKIEH